MIMVSQDKEVGENDLICETGTGMKVLGLGEFCDKLDYGADLQGGFQIDFRFFVCLFTDMLRQKVQKKQK